MAKINEKWAINKSGAYYVDQECIDCDTCRTTAPDFFIRDEEEAHSYVQLQPETPEEIEQEGLTHVVHKRRFKTGPRPGLTSKAIVGGAAARLEDQAWIPPVRKPGRRQKKRMAGCVMKSACRLVMRNHFYSYNNSISKVKEVRLETSSQRS